MKKPILLLLALATAQFCWAGSLSFVKLKQLYRISFAVTNSNFMVLSDEGDGWYRCLDLRDNNQSYLNLQQALEIIPLSDPAGSGALRPGASQVPPLTEKVRRLVLSNLRVLSAGVDQFRLANGVSPAKLDDLVGPTKYMKELKVIDGEDYSQLHFRQGVALTVVTRTGMMVSYEP